MATLHLNKISKSYGHHTILQEISLQSNDGEFLVLVGPSGCGKSTLLNLLAGLDNPTSGTISIGGKVVNDVAARDRNIAMVFQSYALYPNMTVRENIAFALEMRKVSKPEREKNVAQVSQMLQIENLLDRKPHQLSGGQRQRVAMGRALVRNPEVFLFDEPLSNLDAKLRVEMRTEIKRLHQRLGTTVVYVTHDQIEAMTLANRIAVMKDGILQQFADPQTIYDAPANTFVAGFIGSPSMNFIPAVLDRGDGGLCLHLGENGRTVRWPVSTPSSATEGWIGKKILAGVRPENVTGYRPHLESTGHHFGFEAHVDVMEPTGPDTMVHFQLSDRLITARVRPAEAHINDGKMKLMINAAKTLLFDPGTQARID